MSLSSTHLDTDSQDFKSGFVNIIGRPNVGKSTLLNHILGEKICAVSHKSQTTRKRIRGILNGTNFQMVFSDTPGIITKTNYKLHKAMNNTVKEATRDADILLLMFESKKINLEEFSHLLLDNTIKIGIIINKIDLSNQEDIQTLIDKNQNLINNHPVFCISALNNLGIGSILKFAKESLPVHEPYFEDDILTDRSERFIVAELIREKMYFLFQQEIPYSCEVVITNFKEEEDVCKIEADISVERESQKGIVIGKNGEKIKRLSQSARKEIKSFIQKDVFLELRIKVSPNWRNNSDRLNEYGY